MDFSFTDDQEGIRHLLKQLLGDLVTDESLKALQRDGQWFHERAWRQLADSEMLGLGLPEEVGGAGMGLIELCILLHQVGRTVAPIPALPTLMSAALPIAEYGTDEQKQLLRGVAKGETILSVALSQVESRDPRRPAAKAEAADSGWALTGTFTNVPYADRAARILVPAQTRRDSVGVFMVDPRAAGVSIEPQVGTDGEPLSLLRLDGVVVPRTEVIGSLNAGPEVLKFIIDRTVLGMCAMQCGIAEQALFLTANYSSERKQFGVPIATFQGVTQRVGDAYIDVQAMKATMWQACWRLAQGLDADKELAVAKFWASEGGARVVAAAVHVHGGMGFDRDYPLYRYFLTSKHLEFTLGGAMEQLAALGDMLAA